MFLPEMRAKTPAETSKCKYGPRPRFTTGGNLNPGKRRHLSFRLKPGLQKVPPDIYVMKQIFKWSGNQYRNFLSQWQCRDYIHDDDKNFSDRIFLYTRPTWIWTRELQGRAPMGPVASNKIYTSFWSHCVFYTHFST